MAFIYDLVDTWNNGATTFTAIKMNVTDTASNAASKLMDLQVGGVSRFSVGKSGNFIGGTGVSTIEGSLIFSVVGKTVEISNSASRGVVVKTGTPYSFSSGNADGTIDLTLFRDAADTLAQRRGVNAQTFNIYNTYTDASNYERGFIRWSGNALQIGCDALGTGTRRTTTIFNRDKAFSFNPRIDLRLEPDGGSNQKALSFTYGGGNFLQWGLDGIYVGNFNAGGFSVGFSALEFSAGPANGRDVAFQRSGSGVVALIDNTSGGGALEFREQTAPAAPAANRVRIYAEDDGAGKTRLMARFATGAAVQIAIEP
jgi:hypothetical protein